MALPYNCCKYGQLHFGSSERLNTVSMGKICNDCKLSSSPWTAMSSNYLCAQADQNITKLLLTVHNGFKQISELACQVSFALQCAGSALISSQNVEWGQTPHFCYANGSSHTPGDFHEPHSVPLLQMLTQNNQYCTKHLEKRVLLSLYACCKPMLFAGCLHLQMSLPMQHTCIAPVYHALGLDYS